MAKTTLQKAAKKIESEHSEAKQEVKMLTADNGSASAIGKTQLPEETIVAIFQNKAIKAKEKSVMVDVLLTDHKVTIDELVETAKLQNDVIKATLIEAMELASKKNPQIINNNAFEFAIQSLKENAPRVKWEAAKMISNTAHLFPWLLKDAIVHLLANTEHSGMVVRWSAATALSKIISISSALSKELIPVAEAIVEWEHDNAIKKIYQQALKKCKK